VLEGTVAFTGRLASMKRDDAFALVRKHGGNPRQGVTKATGVLIVGELGWPLLDDGQPSKSLVQARCYGVPIASERRFLEWVGKSVPEEQAQTYTADQLAALSKVPKDVVEQLAVFGLIEPRGGLYGFRDLAAARQIAALLVEGVALSAITRSLHEVRKWLPDAHLSKLRLFPESSDKILVEQMNGRTDKTGQYVLSVGQSEDLDALFQRAQHAEEENDIATAERLYERVMKLDPGDPAAPFNLANILRSQNRVIEAEALYRKVCDASPDYAVAWYNLADVLDGQGRTSEAALCLERAIKADPAFVDAIFNLALLLQQTERYPEAAMWWKRYLGFDSESPWAARAKRALKFCEIQSLS
jgi:tetratricopeptide (TPR) repeat protein